MSPVVLAAFIAAVIVGGGVVLALARALESVPPAQGARAPHAHARITAARARARARAGAR